MVKTWLRRIGPGTPGGRRWVVGLNLFVIAELLVWTVLWLMLDWWRPPVVVFIVGCSAVVLLTVQVRIMQRATREGS